MRGGPDRIYIDNTQKHQRCRWQGVRWAAGAPGSSTIGWLLATGSMAARRSRTGRATCKATLVAPVCNFFDLNPRAIGKTLSYSPRPAIERAIRTGAVSTGRRGASICFRARRLLAGEPRVRAAAVARRAPQRALAGEGDGRPHGDGSARRTRPPGTPRSHRRR